MQFRQFAILPNYWIVYRYLYPVQKSKQTRTNRKKPIADAKLAYNAIKLCLRWSDNSPFGVGIAIGIETMAVTAFVDFDSEPDSDFDEFSQYKDCLS